MVTGRHRPPDSCDVLQRSAALLCSPRWSQLNRARTVRISRGFEPTVSRNANAVIWGHALCWQSAITWSILWRTDYLCNVTLQNQFMQSIMGAQRKNPEQTAASELVSSWNQFLLIVCFHSQGQTASSSSSSRSRRPLRGGAPLCSV